MAYVQYTRAQMRDMLQLKVESVPFWVAAEANDAINEALLVWNSLTGYWKSTQEITTTATNWDYTLNGTMVFGTRVEYEGRGLSQSSMMEMDAGLPGWQGQMTTDGGNVPTTPQIWFPLSIDVIGIWPADAVGGHTLTVDGIAQTPILVSDVSYIQIGQEEFDAILGYALHALALKEGGERFAATMPLFKDFLMQAAEENDQLATSSYFRQFVGIDMGRQEKPTHGTPNDYAKLAQ